MFRVQYPTWLTLKIDRVRKPHTREIPGKDTDFSIDQVERRDSFMCSADASTWKKQDYFAYTVHSSPFSETAQMRFVDDALATIVHDIGDDDRAARKQQTLRFSSPTTSTDRPICVMNGGNLEIEVGKRVGQPLVCT